MSETKKTLAEAPVDVSELTRLWQEIFEKSNELGAAYIAQSSKQSGTETPDEIGIGKAFTALSEQLLSDPEQLVQSTTQFWEQQVALWQQWITSDPTSTNSDTSVQKPKSDARFRNELWNTWLFDYIKNAYLLTAEHIQKTVNGVDSLDEATSRKVKFFTKQYVDALSPTNFAALNPEVIKETVDSGGKNLLDGVNNLLRDLKKGDGGLAIKMVDTNAFKLGEDVAASKGKVVYQNDLMQLIQYAPTTPESHEVPLLIVPPWINKYYILDLKPKNSFIKWALDQGHTVFVISWVNPDKEHADKTFDDYLTEGPLKALEEIETRCGTKTTNIIGYCLGGTLTAILIGWLEAKGQSDRINSATFFTSMIDFEEPGELGVFIDADQVEALEKRMAEKGYLEGSEMASTFNLLRANDLIWSFVINNYLLGKEPIPFDLLFWNSDATRMPAKMHSFYLRNMYIDNKLREPGGITVAKKRIDLSKVSTPTYFISTRDDHIAPWKSTFSGAKLFGGDTRFVLGGSGHIAGIVNPPAANKYCYWTNPELSHDAERWLEQADKTDGSWWGDWSNWIHAYTGEKISARELKGRKTQYVEDAPGSYAKFRLDNPQSAPVKKSTKKRAATTKKKVATRKTKA